MKTEQYPLFYIQHEYLAIGDLTVSTVWTTKAEHQRFMAWWESGSRSLKLFEVSHDFPPTECGGVGDLKNEMSCWLAPTVDDAYAVVKRYLKEARAALDKKLAQRMAERFKEGSDVDRYDGSYGIYRAWKWAESQKEKEVAHV